MPHAYRPHVRHTAASLDAAIDARASTSTTHAHLIPCASAHTTFATTSNHFRSDPSHSSTWCKLMPQMSASGLFHPLKFWRRSRSSLNTLRQLTRKGACCLGWGVLTPHLLSISYKCWFLRISASLISRSMIVNRIQWHIYKASMTSSQELNQWTYPQPVPSFLSWCNVKFVSLSWTKFGCSL